MTIPNAAERARLLALCDGADDCGVWSFPHGVTPATVRAMVEATRIAEELDRWLLVIDSAVRRGDSAGNYDGVRELLTAARRLVRSDNG